jgi:hypothetical protein
MMVWSAMVIGNLGKRGVGAERNKLGEGDGVGGDGEGPCEVAFGAGVRVGEGVEEEKEVSVVSKLINIWVALGLVTAMITVSDDES